MQKKAVTLAVMAMISSSVFAQVTTELGPLQTFPAGPAGNNLVVPGVAIFNGPVIVDDLIALNPDVTVIQEGLVQIQGAGGAPDVTTITGGVITVVDITSTGTTNGLQANKLSATNGSITDLAAGSIASGSVQANSVTAISAIFGGGVAVSGSKLTVNGDASFSGILDVVGSSTLSGATNTIGRAGNTVNTLQGSTNSIIGSLGTTISTGGTLGAVTGNRAIVDMTSARFVSANGNNNFIVNDAAGVAMSGNSASGTLNATDAIYLNSNGRGLDVDAGSALLSGGTAVSAATLELTTNNARTTAISSNGVGTTTIVDVGNITVPAGASSGFHVSNGSQSIILNDGSVGSRSIVLRDSNGAVYVDNGSDSVGLRNGATAGSATARVNIGSTTGTVTLSSQINNASGHVSGLAVAGTGAGAADAGNVTLFSAGRDDGTTSNQTTGGVLRMGAANAGAGGIGNAQGIVVNGSGLADVLTGVAASTTVLSGGTGSAASNLSLDAVRVSLEADDGRGLTINTALTGGVSLTGGQADGVTGNIAVLKIAQDGRSASLMNNVADASNGLDGHGLSITASHSLLTGGTNSSSLLLQDAAATLSVGTAATGETVAIAVSGTDNGVGGTNTAVSIGGISNTSTTIQSTGANSISGTTNTIAGSFSSSISGGTSRATLSNSGVEIVGNTTVNGTLQTTGNTLIGGLLTATDGIVSGAINVNNSTSGANNISGVNTLTVATVNATNYNVADVNASHSITAPNAYLGGAGGKVDVAAGTAVTFNGNRLQAVGPATAGTDAVNLNQLNSVNSNLQSQISDNRNEARRGIAGASAIAGIPALESGKQYNFGVGLGHYKGESALALGGNARFDAKTVGRLAVGFSGSDATVSAGVGWSF